MTFRNCPIIKRLYNKFDTYNSVIEKLSNELSIISTENIDLRFKVKKINNEKINVVFVCWRPAVWTSLKSVYEAMKQDDTFIVTIVTIPNKKQLPGLYLNHEVYESEGAEDFWKGDDIISGYNYETKEWMDLKSLNPDYVCFQQPYNICRPDIYKSEYVSKFAKIFHVEYGYISQKYIGIDCLPKDFIKDVDYLFTMHKEQENWYTPYFKDIKNTKTKMILTGYPRFDNLNKYKNCESDLWKDKNKRAYRIIWTPRWCFNENNCHFLEYKDLLFSYFENKDEFNFMFRPHPQAFLNYVGENKITPQKLDEYINKIKNSKNMILDQTTDFLKNFYSSDCLITDYSSVVVEYFMTGKPIIYCYNKQSIVNNEGEITKGFYNVNNWNELVKTLEMLKRGEDPLAEVRKDIITKYFYLPKEGAGNKIKDFVKKDFNK